MTGLAGEGLEAIDLEVREEQIVGLTGLPGSGFEAIPYLLTGARRATSGTLRTKAGDLDLTRAGVADCMAAGVSLVPERRDRDGLALELSISDNIALPSLRRRGSSWFVGRRWQRQQSEELIDRLSIRTRTPATLIKELSGGNQQKVLFAKWLSIVPSLFVLHEATQAVDVGARQDILAAIQRVAETGVGVLLASGEPCDLVEVCDCDRSSISRDWRSSSCAATAPTSSSKGRVPPSPITAAPGGSRVNPGAVERRCRSPRAQPRRGRDAIAS